jgi:N-methylhydantoinase A
MSVQARRTVSAREAALGVVQVVNAGMERALRVISVERGYDPREFALIPFGGAGGLHAVELARSLRIPRIIMPRAAGALSALGALGADVVKDASRTVMLEAGGANNSQLESVFEEMERAARTALRLEGFDDSQQRHVRQLAARYKGQSFELEIKWTRGSNLNAAFHRAHRARYGYAQEANTVEIVSARLRSIGLVRKPKPERAKRVTRARAIARPAAEVKVYFADGPKRAALYVRDELATGARLRSPAVITEYSATTLIPPGARAVVDTYRNIIIEP